MVIPISLNTGIVKFLKTLHTAFNYLNAII